MKIVLGFLKVLFFGVVILLFFVTTYLVRLVIRNQKKRRQFYARFVSYICRFGVWFLNTKVIVKNPPDFSKNYLFVSNHLGILDVIILASIQPCLFITSVEMQQTPFLGLICEMGGCLFVERRSRSNIYGEIGQIREALNEGHNIGLYPEGTSTNGEKVLPFKKSLLTSAAGTEAPILPMVLNYKEINGEPVTPQNRDSVFWYGDQTFPPIFWNLMTNRSIVAEIEFFQEIHVESEEQRREIADKAYHLVSSRYIPIA